jgi:hypothetical protein
MKTCKVLKPFVQFDAQGNWKPVLQGATVELPDAKANRLAAVHVVEIIGGQPVSVETAELPAAETADLPRPKRGKEPRSKKL